MVIYNRIPEENKDEVIKVVDRVLKNLINPPHKCMVYLFEVYNEYIAPAHRPEDLNCGECRAKVVGQFRIITTEWKQQRTTLEK